MASRRSPVGTDTGRARKRRKAGQRSSRIVRTAGAARRIPPILHRYRLRCGADRAFSAYTERIGEWWDPAYTANPATLSTVVIEPRVGGRVFARHSDVGEDQWGVVRVWKPGRKLVHSFTLAQDPTAPSEVSVEFVPGKGGTGCELGFAHGGWNSRNAGAREKFSDWAVMLERFVKLAETAG